MIDLILGDCVDVMREMEDCSVDAVVCDPPYYLSFMGKSWDKAKTSMEQQRLHELWATEALRVLKPGGHLLAFGGTRTVHRLTSGIEDAGFEIRDSIMWIYGSGFPKSLDVSKAIDKAAGAEREVVGRRTDRAATPKQDIRGGRYIGGESGAIDCSAITAPATDAAKKWEGWGTALKPAHEPIVLARKPLIGTVAANVMEFGTGALNVDGCRVGTGGDRISGGPRGSMPQPMSWGDDGVDREARPTGGRWPPNLCLSHHPDCDMDCHPDCPVKALGEMSGEQSDGTAGRRSDGVGLFGTPGHDKWGTYGGHGTAARFFPCFHYTAKASTRERNLGLNEGERNKHPTVKPVDLMRWLVRLVAPPGGVVLDPFLGSGSTGMAAAFECVEFIGIEKEEKSFEDARNRISWAVDFVRRHGVPSDMKEVLETTRKQQKKAFGIPQEELFP